MNTGTNVDIMSHEMLHRVEQELKQGHVKCHDERLGNGARATVYPDPRGWLLSKIPASRGCCCQVGR